jgi:hypothetical protein
MVKLSVTIRLSPHCASLAFEPAMEIFTAGSYKHPIL